MCYHNYTCHNGCGHIGESHISPITLCADAEQRLALRRGPMSPPLPTSPPPKNTFPFPPPKHRPTSKLHKRIASFSASISRTTSSASMASSRRAVSGPSRTSTSSFASSGAELGIADHELEAVKCERPQKRSLVSNGMDVCKECGKWVREMRFMLERFDKTGSVRGTGAFEEFLKGRANNEQIEKELYRR
ncbi:hypothetical protein K469DRAFT_233931 [Zopfia rhizophila CBS 207.26]|uniref:Uncharacterized protein n=1 Tax=Zopfia rhizophila CBS 207.26 TaxID=1314779 RepID=A0A6A6DTS8_9PEZI|nr:hypothetical protein K469DRAFT_233931 [Zopfia rhizophila CBS 207.26]